MSFKLETDEAILVKKAAGALGKYKMHCVVANMLQTRYDTVLLVTPPEVASGEPGLKKIQRGAAPLIEEELVGALCEMHKQYYAAGAASSS